MNRPIAAVATPIGVSAIGAIRISGAGAIELIDRFFRGKSRLADTSANSVRFGQIFDGEECIDQVVATVFRAPHSYTGEDTVELSCHGNPFIIKRLYDLLIQKGASAAQPGEFTQRAFLNGKLDINQAEAVNDLIRAHTVYSQASALSHLSGKFSGRIEPIHNRLLDAIALIETAIDHSDLELDFASRADLLERLQTIVSDIEGLLATADAGRIVRQGLKLAIVGAPNTGKSSLMNALLKADRVIVSDIPGTTRDLIEEELSIRGIPIRIQDTAGIRDTCDSLEKLGMARSQSAIAESDLRIFLFDASRRMDAGDRAIAEQIGNKPTVWVLNKSDIADEQAAGEVRAMVKCLDVSSKTGVGLEALEAAIADFYFSLGHSPLNEALVVNSRQEECLKRASESTKQALEALKQNRSEEFVAGDLRNARRALEELIGRTTDDAVLDRIFSQFCIGK